MPLKLHETCDPTAAIHEDPTPSHDNSWAIALPQNEAVNHDDANDKDWNPGSQPRESHHLPYIVQTSIVNGSA